MEFNIKMSDFVIQSKIVYISNEYAFQTIPKLPTDVSLLFENLCINISSDDNTVYSIDGYHPKTCWIDKELIIPKCQEGKLIVNGNYESGDVKRLAPICTYQTFYDSKTGWLCIGTDKLNSTSVIILNNVIATIKDKKMIALWLNPEFK